jgi:hypothetical protein
MPADRSRSRPLLLGLFGAIIVINAVIFPWASRAIGSDGVPFRPLDLRLSYSADEAYTAIGSLTPDARRLYAIVELSVDIVYPIVYSLLFFLLIRRLIGSSAAPPRWLERATLIPFVTMFFDWLENVGIVAMIAQFPDGLERLAPFSSAITTLKWVCFLLTVALLLYSVVRWMVSRRPRTLP